LKAGRVRVRVHGLHTPKLIKSDTEGIPTNELPWAEPCFPIQEGSISGFGMWSVPLQGSHVMLFFENSNPSQPRYFASMPGIPESKESYKNNNRVTSKRTDGFRDPDGKYPTQWRLGEPDFHRLSRGVSDDTLVITKNEQRDIGVPTALGGNWSEPQSPYGAKYPHNYVIATHGGLTIELDSTPNSKRVHIYHPSNSFIEIDNDGNMVVKNNAEKYEIVTQGKNIHIKQQRNITIDDNSKKRIGTDEDIEVGNDKTENIGNDMDQTIGNDKTEDIGNDKNETIGNDKNSNIGNDKVIVIGNDKNETIGNNETVDVGTNKTETIGGALNITVTGAVNLTAGGNVHVTAPITIITGLVRLANQSSLMKLVTDEFVSLYNSHQHTGIESGGSVLTFSPIVPMGAAQLTANTTAS
jgi:hypothetical protein